MSNVSDSPTSCQAFPDPIADVLRFGTLNLFAGASGVGKTITIAEWCQRMRTGRPIWGHATNRPTEIYVLAADRGWVDYGAAFACAGFPEVRHYALADDDGLNLPSWIKLKGFERLENCISRLNPLPGSLLIIDPLSPLFVSGQTNRGEDVAPSMHLIRRLGRKLQLTILGTSNVVKQKAEEGYVRPQDRISGSGAFAAYTDTQIYLMPVNDKPKSPLVLGWTPRRAKAEEFRVIFDSRTKLFRAHQGIFEPDAPPTQTHERRAALLTLIPPGGIPKTELREQAALKFQIARPTVYRDLDALKLGGQIREEQDVGGVILICPIRPS